MEGLPPSAINPRRWLVLTVVVAAQFMYVVDIFIVNVAIPSIRTDLDASTAQIESVIAIYQIAYASMVITGGRLGDMYGARRLFLIGLIGLDLPQPRSLAARRPRGVRWSSRVSPRASQPH